MGIDAGMLRLIRRMVPLLAVVWLLGVCGGARAFLPSFGPSIELSASRADCVVTGVIVRRESLPGPWSAWLRLTVKTTERLLGDPGDEFVCVIPDLYPGHAVVGEEALFLLMTGAHCAALMPGPANPWLVGIGWTTVPQDVGVLLDSQVGPIPLRAGTFSQLPMLDVAPCRDRQDLLDRVRAYCVRPLPAARVELLWNPSPLPGTPIDGFVLVIGVPIDDHVQGLARGWIGSADDVVRGNGVRVLRNVHSAENVEALRQLARRPVATQEQDVARTMALSTLVDWGEVADWTRDRGSYTPHGPAAFDFWLSIACVGVVPVCYLCVVARGRVWRRAAVVGWLLGVSFLLIVLLRSLFSMDGFESGIWKGGAVRGDVYVMWAMRDDVKHGEPFHLENPHNVPDLMSPPYMHFDSWRFDPKRPVAYFIKPFGMTAALQDVYPLWSGIVFRVPLWMALVLWCLPVAMVRVVRRWREWRVVQRRGFPVEGVAQV